MKDYGYTSFGLLIGFFLPGFVGLFSLKFWSGSVGRWFDAVTTPASGVGPLSIVLIVSLAIGLQVSLCRWLVFEKWVCRNHRLEAGDFQKLSGSGHLGAFQVVIEQHYRYHQFWGGVAVVLPVGLVGWLASGALKWTPGNVLGVVFLILLEALTFWGAVEAFRLYVSRGNAILREERSGMEALNAERNGS